MSNKTQPNGLPRDQIYIIPEAGLPHTEHNYEKEINRLRAMGVLKTGDVSIINIAHDDWCGLYKQQRCNCDVQIINRLTGRIINANANG